MKQYLLDTNIVIFLLRSRFVIHEKIAFVGLDNCFISEITLAELKIGAEKSAYPAQVHTLIDQFCQTVTVLPITKVLGEFAAQKVRLEKSGTPMHDHFDVLLAATALVYGLVMVTNNVRHFSFFPSLVVEDWTREDAPEGFVSVP